MSAKEQLLPSHDIQALFDLYREQLSKQPRYERFMQGENLSQWAYLLGPDVIGLTHPRVTAEITERFIDFNERHGLHLLPQEQIQLRTVPWIHDLGEVKLDERSIGDISYDQKTAFHEQQESRVFSLVVEHMSEGQEKALIQTVYPEIAIDKTTKLGRMFNAIERIGYLETGIRTFKGVNGERITNWIGLVGNVLSNQTEMLLAYAKEYPYVREILKSHEATIETMLLEVAKMPVPPDAQGNPSYDLAKFNRARELWRHRTLSAA